MVYDKARELAAAMAESEEYVTFKNSKEKAFANDTTKALLKEYAQGRRAPEFPAKRMTRP